MAITPPSALPTALMEASATVTVPTTTRKAISKPLTMVSVASPFSVTVTSSSLSRTSVGSMAVVSWLLKPPAVLPSRLRLP